MRIIVNGTFDILHRGHIELLKYAQSLGDHLLVVIDTDRRVKELKGVNRPINNQSDRKLMLESLKYVDQVEFFDTSEELIEILKAYQADIMVKGSDYRDKSIVGKNYCKQVIYYDRVGDYSTTNTIQHISNR
jgi:D-beta-D-heptose 7-phosphate kinase/D-beta-D-heptose 1-phosphate adenosyltransferase